MRLFAGVMIDDAARAKIARVLDALEKTGADYKWVEPANLHLTLRFYGAVEDAKLPELKAALAAAANRVPFQVELPCLGAFSGMKNPRVVFLEATKGADELKAMAAALGEEERFKAHLTLGRQRSLKGLGALTRLLASYEVEPITFTIDRVALIESKLSPKGPKYEVKCVERCARY